MSRYVLGPAARRDLLEAFRRGIRLHGAQQAASYQQDLERVLNMLAEFPDIARERTEFRIAVRVHHHQRHYIIYVKRPDRIRILRIVRDGTPLSELLGRL